MGNTFLETFGLQTGDLPGLMILGLFVVLMLGFALAARKRPWRNMRPITAFSRLLHAVGLAVEDGSRLHVSIGRGTLTSPSSAAAFVGLSMLSRIARIAAESDTPPVATTGDGALSILTRDTLRSAARAMGTEDQFEPTAGRLVGLTPFSYAAGLIPILQDENVSASVLAGNFGTEVALITDAGEQSGGFILAGTDSIPAQAILYATAQEPLIGEELYAGGAYMRAGAMHAASLRTQDAIRWLLVMLILGGGLWRLLGGFFS